MQLASLPQCYSWFGFSVARLINECNGQAVYLCIVAQYPQIIDDMRDACIPYELPAARRSDDGDDSASADMFASYRSLAYGMVNWCGHLTISP